MYTLPEYVASEIRASTAFSSSTLPTLADVNRWIEEASNQVELRTNQVFSSTVHSSVFMDYTGGGSLALPYYPVLSIEELRYNKYQVGQAPEWINLSEGYDQDYILYSNEGNLEFIHGVNRANPYSPQEGRKKFCVSYTTGYSSTPLDVQQLTTQLVALRVINSLSASQANEEGGSIQVGTIRIADPTSFSVNYLKSLREQIDEGFKKLNKDFQLFIPSRVY